MTVSDYGKASTKAVFHVEISDVSEGDEAIIETPVTSVPPTIPIVVECSWNYNNCVILESMWKIILLLTILP